MPLALTINGKHELLDLPESGATIRALLDVLKLKSDRVAIELNGRIASRAGWDDLLLSESDQIELVHFVGGGTDC